MRSEEQRAARNARDRARRAARKAGIELNPDGPERGPGGLFKKGDPRLKELGRQGHRKGMAAIRARQGDIEPYAGDFLTFRDAVHRSGETRELWTVIWKAADGLPLSARELELFQKHTGRTVAPTEPARQVWIMAGRRGGKSENTMVRATWRAMSKAWKKILSPGERAVIPIIASDKDQAENTLGYLKGLCADPHVAPYVAKERGWSVDFKTGARVQVRAANFRRTRGYTLVDAVLEECAFYAAEDSSNPDREILKAIRPGLGTVKDSRIYAISSPYAKRGILYQAWSDHWGKDGDPVLVINCSTQALNPTFPSDTIAEEWAEDPESAAAEYGAEGMVSFRSDVSALLPPEAVKAVTVLGRRELPPLPDFRYVAFADPSGGSLDSFALGIAHLDGETAVLDLLREHRPPFKPTAVVAELAKDLKRYGLTMVTGDRYAGAWCSEAFAEEGIMYVASDLTRSAIYIELLPLINAARCALLDDPRLRAQLTSLERRTAWGGKDSIDHPPNGHDDVANSGAGALVLAAAGAGMTAETEGQVFEEEAPLFDLEAEAARMGVGVETVAAAAKETTGASAEKV